MGALSSKLESLERQLKDCQELSFRLLESQRFLRQLVAMLLLKFGNRQKLDPVFYLTRMPSEPIIMTQNDPKTGEITCWVSNLDENATK